MRINLSDGRVSDGRAVTIDSFYVTRTYGGVLEGLPTCDLNTTLIESAKKKLVKLWGDGRKIHVLSPTLKSVPQPPGPDFGGFYRSGRSEPEMLPKFQCSAWLDSASISKKANGSHVFLIWWTDEVEAFSVQGLVLEAFRGVKWEDAAEDYEA